MNGSPGDDKGTFVVPDLRATWQLISGNRFPTQNKR